MMPPSHWKFITAHEAGHLVQDRAMGDTFAGYRFSCLQPDNTFKNQDDPCGSPVLCGCSHVTSANSLHPPGILNSAYGTSKAALNQFTRHLAAELEGTGVTANVIHPGDLKTEMWADIKAQVEALGPIADPYAQWVDWVAETGGDPIEKAAKLVVDIVASDVSGQFLWIDDPLQPPIQSWGEADAQRPWND